MHLLQFDVLQGRRLRVQGRVPMKLLAVALLAALAGCDSGGPAAMANAGSTGSAGAAGVDGGSSSDGSTTDATQESAADCGLPPCPPGVTGYSPCYKDKTNPMAQCAPDATGKLICHFDGLRCSTDDGVEVEFCTAMLMFAAEGQYPEHTSIVSCLSKSIIATCPSP
jgi:hypothetical protein